MEASNLADIEFKKVNIRILKELSENFNGIKKLIGDTYPSHIETM